MKLRFNKRVSVLGDGGWGTTLALLLAGKGYRVHLWGAFEEYSKQMQKSRENVKFLPGFKIPENVEIGSDMRRALEFSDVIVLAVPSQHMRKVLVKIRSFNLKNKFFVNVSKGIETQTLMTMSQVIGQELGKVNLAVVSGPTIARDVALHMPSAASVACKDKKLRKFARETFSTDYFKLFESDDLVGVELGGSVKNVIAIGAGILQGAGLTSNTRAVLFARGVAEMARLGKTMGARRETFMGLSGLGDLATTCLSPHSRNRTLGEQVGKGMTLANVLKSSPMVVEGVDTCVSVRALAKKNKIAMPICEAVYQILFKKQKPDVIVQALMRVKTVGELE